jgi:hypothetical protein
MAHEHRPLRDREGDRVMADAKLTPMHDPGWPDALIADIEQSTKDAMALETARHGENAPPVSAIMTGKMFGSVVAAVHELAKDFAQLRKHTDANSEAINQTVESFAKALADMEEHNFKYRGYWRRGMHAERGDVYTNNGSLWFCMSATDDQPSKESLDWNLCARAGRDGKDLR